VPAEMVDEPVATVVPVSSRRVSTRQTTRAGPIPSVIPSVIPSLAPMDDDVPVSSRREPTTRQSTRVVPPIPSVAPMDYVPVSSEPRPTKREEVSVVSAPIPPPVTKTPDGMRDGGKQTRRKRRKVKRTRKN
jgi:hypothetical protein